MKVRFILNEFKATFSELKVLQTSHQWTTYHTQV